MKKTIGILLALTLIFALCGCSLDSNPFHKHQYSWNVISDKYLKSTATCTDKAQYYYSCACGAYGKGGYFEVGEPLGHDYSGSVFKEPTVDEYGVMRYVCSRCGSTYDEPIDKLFCGDTVIHIGSESFVAVEYIESTGTQYIDTGFSTTTGMTTEFECMWLGGSGGYMVGSHSISSPYGRNGGYLDIGRNFWELGFGEVCPNVTRNTDVVGKKLSVSFSTVSGNAYLSVDGQEMIRDNGNQKTSPENVLLFYNQYSKNGGSPTTIGRLYSASIWDGKGTLVREFVPVLRVSDGTIGMLDTVHEKFYVSETDEFKYGSVLHHRLDSGNVIKEPSYCEDGIKEYVCSGCGLKLHDVLDKTAYSVTFDCPDEAAVYIYESQDYSMTPVSSSVTYTRNNDSFEYSKTDAQVNFMIAVKDGYVLNGITIDGEYKNLKNPKDNIFRITKIGSDLTVHVDVGIELSLSAESGFYDDEFSLELSAQKGTIYYTLDGSEPTVNSLKYTGPITIKDASANPNTNSMLTTTSGGFLEDKINRLGNNSNTYPYFIPGYKAPDTLIDKCTVVKAIAIDGDVASNVVCGSYFVGFDNKDGYDNAGVISLIVEPDDFFGYEKGIYVMGKTYDTVDSSTQWYAPYWWWWWSNYSNSGDAWERPVNLSFFNSDKELILQKDCGARIRGNGSRGYVEKSLNFYARSEYDGQDFFDYKFFDNDYIAQRLTLASGGDDYTTKLYDYLMSATGQDADYCIAKMQRYTLFINGEYWGSYYLSEKLDEEYFNYYYGVDKDNLVMIKDGSVEEGKSSDIGLYNDMVNYISSNDMTVEANYSKALDMLDIDSYIDYYASMAYIGRKGDWPGGNTSLWRSREKGASPYEDCKWRYVMFDINSGAYEQYDNDWVNYIVTNNRMFRHLYRNESFKAQFDAKLVELAGTRFAPSKINGIIDTFKAETRDQMILEYSRFFGSSNTMITDEFDAKVDRVKEFMNKRYQYILETYGGGVHIHSYTGKVTKAATFTEKGTMTYTCECGDSYTEDIPMLKYADFAYAADIVCDEHVKVYVYVGQNYKDAPTLSSIAYSTDKKGNLLKDGEGQINMLVVCDEGYAYDIAVDGTFKNLKGSEDTKLDDVYRITKIESDLTITVTSKISEK